MVEIKDKLIAGIVMAIIGYLGLTNISGSGMMGSGMMMGGFGMMGASFGLGFISYLLLAVFLGVMLLGIYMMYEAVK